MEIQIKVNEYDTYLSDYFISVDFLERKIQ